MENRPIAIIIYNQVNISVVHTCMKAGPKARTKAASCEVTYQERYCSYKNNMTTILFSVKDDCPLSERISESIAFGWRPSALVILIFFVFDVQKFDSKDNKTSTSQGRDGD